jgi:methylmalonyl-CoA mutase
MTSALKSLATDFSPCERGEWHKLAAQAMSRSGDVGPSEAEGRLATPTDDGYTLRPLYTAGDTAGLPEPPAPGRGDFRRGSVAATHRRGWAIQQRFWGTAAQMQAALASEAASDAESIWLTLLPGVFDLADLPDLLARIDCNSTRVTLEAFGDAVPAGEILLAALETAPKVEGGSLGLDPLGALAGMGRAGDISAAVELALRASELGVQAFCIDGSIYHEAGASFGEEIGSATAAGVATLRWLIDAGLDVTTASELIEFRFAVTDDQFASIAKLRAARLVWHRVLEVADVQPKRGQRQQAVTSWAMLSQRDSWVNLIRNTVAAFAGGVGGADSVTVLPHTTSLEYPDELAQRLAVNTQHLLLEESHVGVVDDAFGGSWYAETRTRQLADAAWEWLQELEGSGGLLKSLGSGLVDERITRTWQIREARIATRRSPLTGVSEFPDAIRLTDPGMQGFRRPGGGLPQRRRSAQFEELRDRSDRAVANGQAVRVFLIKLGSTAENSARVSFARNLFAAGGIDSVEIQFEPDAALDLPADGSAVVACICGGDRDYANMAVAAAGTLPRDASIWLAGKAGEAADAYATAGFGGFLFSGCDALAVLLAILAQLEVPQ